MLKHTLSNYLEVYSPEIIESPAFLSDHPDIPDDNHTQLILRLYEDLENIYSRGKKYFTSSGPNVSKT
jgi:hypothetical protein